MLLLLFKTQTLISKLKRKSLDDVQIENFELSRKVKKLDNETIHLLFNNISDNCVVKRVCVILDVINILTFRNVRVVCVEFFIKTLDSFIMMKQSRIKMIAEENK